MRGGAGARGILAEHGLRDGGDLGVGGVEPGRRLQVDLDDGLPRHRAGLDALDIVHGGVSTRSYEVVIRPSSSSAFSPLYCQATAITGILMVGKMSVGVRAMTWG
jgi:hypothetical protein